MGTDVVTTGDGQGWNPLFWFWITVTLVASAVLLTDLVVQNGAGGLVIDWTVGPAFIAVIGGVWGARSARKRLATAEAEEDRLLDAEERELLAEVARGTPEPDSLADPEG